MNGVLGRSTGRRSLVFFLLLSLLPPVYRPPAAADIFRWDSGELITEKDAEPGADLRRMDLSYADLAGALLSAADFDDADLTFAHLMGADLTDADFNRASLTDANLSHSDLRGAEISASQITSTASVRGTILPDGRIEGLTLAGDQWLLVRDDDGYSDESTSRDPIPITVDSVMSVAPAATLYIVFEDADWGSTISFEPGTSVALDGTLGLLFKGALVGTTFDLFDWAGATVTGTFRIASSGNGSGVWDTADLYTSGEVTLLSIIGDVNLDGDVNGLDVDPFVDVLLNGPYQVEADINQDGVVNGLDVDPFVSVYLVGGTTGVHQIPEPATLLLGLVAMCVVGGWRKRSG